MSRCQVGAGVERGETRADGELRTSADAIHSKKLVVHIVGGCSHGFVSVKSAACMLFSHGYNRESGLTVSMLFYSCIIRVTFCQITICHVYHACQTGPILRAATNVLRCTLYSTTSPQSHLPRRRRQCRPPESLLPTRARAPWPPAHSSAPACAGSWGSAWP